VKVKTWAVLQDCIERGIEIGWARAHKHTDAPTEHEIKWQIEHEIDCAISEYFTFNDDLEDLP
jgi:hypothetical protein